MIVPRSVGELVQLDPGFNREVRPTGRGRARWIVGERTEGERFLELNRSSTARDRDDAPVYLAKNAWDVGYAQEKNPDIRFTATKERLL